jgi:hypothetical protein
MNADPLPLSSPRWKQLEHAYGSADSIPALITRIQQSKTRNASYWDELWSSICHQDTVYSGTFAAIPHLVRIIEADRSWKQRFDVYHMVGYSHLCANASGVEPALDLVDAYTAAVRTCLNLIGADLDSSWSTLEARTLAACVLSFTGDFAGARLLFNWELLEGESVRETIEPFRLDPAAKAHE